MLYNASATTWFLFACVIGAVACEGADRREDSQRGTDCDAATCPPSHAFDPGEEDAGEVTGPDGAAEAPAKDTGVVAADGGASSPNAPAICESDDDCKATYCGGHEHCRLAADGVRRCAPAPIEEQPCYLHVCNEAEQRCEDCDPHRDDRDNDGVMVRGCVPKGTPFDCDDGDADRYPGNSEVCYPTHCDPATGRKVCEPDHDEDCDPTTYAKLDPDGGPAKEGGGDEDGDGSISSACVNEDPVGLREYAAAPADPIDDPADPRAAFVQAGPEICDGFDNDGDGKVDNLADYAETGLTFYRDKDGDQYGDESEGTLRAFCMSPPDGWALLKGDCNDNEPSIHPGDRESIDTCNGVDDDCNGVIDDIPLRPYYAHVKEIHCAGAAGWVIDACDTDYEHCTKDVTKGCETKISTLCNCRSCNTSCMFACGGTGCEEPATFALGSYHTCAITGGDDSLASCWGFNRRGQVGDDSINDAAVARRVARLGRVSQITAGNEHSCAIAKADAALYCWGDDSSGQLGATSTDDHSMIPVPVGGLNGGLLTHVRDVVAGAYHTCAVTEAGEALCWGKNDSGQVGNGVASATAVTLPGRVRKGDGSSYLTSIVQVVAGVAHSCALSSEGSVLCWGDDSYGQLGDGGAAKRATAAQPVAQLSGIERLVAGNYYTCALAQGRVTCWGSNAYGQLAVASSDMGAPRKIAALDGHRITGIAAGAQHVCALDADGALYCWGSNLAGELGRPQIGGDPNPEPKRVGLPAVHAVFGGMGNHTCAVLRSGEARCWGANNAGQLGNPTATSDPQPLPQALHPLDGSEVCE